jgi:hypothetical protein
MLLGGALIRSLTTNHVTWEYVNDALGGMQLGAPRSAGGGMILPVNFFIRQPVAVDSAAMVKDIRATVRGDEIEVAVFACLADNHTPWKSEVSIPGARPVRYTVWYLDPDGKRHAMGTLDLKGTPASSASE